MNLTFGVTVDKIVLKLLQNYSVFLVRSLTSIIFGVNIFNVNSFAFILITRNTFFQEAQVLELSSIIYQPEVSLEFIDIFIKL